MTNEAVTTPLGAVVRTDSGYRLEFVRQFPDPIERVWSAVTNSDELSSWYGTWTGDPSTGTIELTVLEAPDHPGTVEIKECDPPRRLSIVVPSPDGDWPLTVDLESTDSGTQLTFTHTLEEPYDATSVGPGWHFYVDRFAANLAGADLPSDWELYAPLGALYPLPE